MAAEADLKSVGRNTVWVQFPPLVPFDQIINYYFFVQKIEGDNNYYFFHTKDTTTHIIEYLSQDNAKISIDREQIPLIGKFLHGSKSVNIDTNTLYYYPDRYRYYVYTTYEKLIQVHFAELL